MIETALYNETSGKYIIKRNVLLKPLNFFNFYCDMLPSRSHISNLYIHKLLYLVSSEYKAVEANVLFYIFKNVNFYIWYPVNYYFSFRKMKLQKKRKINDSTPSHSMELRSMEIKGCCNKDSLEALWICCCHVL